jgi:hypothetical protein
MADTYREDLEMFTKYLPWRDRALSACKEITKPYRESDESTLTTAISKLSANTFMFLRKRYSLQVLRDQNSRLIYTTISLWTRPPVEDIPPPIGIEQFKYQDDVIRCIWNTCSNFCIHHFQQHAELIRAEQFVNRLEQAFPQAAIQALAHCFITHLFPKNGIAFSMILQTTI